jgi:aminoglycoside phosphotransferase (APT) family kinase protein
VAAWVEDALGPDAWIVGMDGVSGQHLNAVHTVEAALGKAGVGMFVVKRFPGEPLDEQVRAVTREATNLELLVPTAVPAPRLVAADPTGEEAGEPTLLMAWLPGAVVLDPPAVETWLRGMAQLLPPVHEVVVPIGVDVRPFSVYNDVDELDVPIWSSDPALWSFVLETAARPAPESSRSFIHRDFHPGNVLWAGGATSGLIDWEPASIGPSAMDLAHCRLNLARLFDVAVADAFLATHTALTGGYEHQPYFDLLSIVDTLPQALPPYGGVLTPHRAKLEAYVRSVVRRF